MSTPLIEHRIGGKPMGDPATVGDVHDPATGSVQAHVAFADAKTVDRAVEAARAVQETWRGTSVPRRAKVLFAFRDLVEAHRDDLARAITAEHGKTLSDAAGEVDRGLEVVEFACGIGHLLKGEHSEQVGPGIDSYSVRQPVGVVAGITPFNFPAMVPMWMFPVALACGNAFLLKPSEKDPTPATLLADLLAEAGLPDGVFNVVHGDRTTVEALLDHPGIGAVSFVGSTPVARAVYERGAAAGKRVQALGGAKNHAVVMPDADLELAADALVSAAYGSAGERCMAVSAVVAVGEVADDLVEALRERVAALRVGPGTDDVDFGPLISAEHRDRVRGYVDAGEQAGARLVVDGRDLDLAGDGFFLGASLFDDVEPDQSIYTDEIFGPVLSVLRVDTLADAIDLVNAGPYGNGTAIFTSDGGAARAFQDRIEVGMVGINVPIPVPIAFHSFGGWKSSLFGDLHVYGPDAVRFYTRTKVVTARWPESQRRGIDLG
ncbi:MAG TPA: CoA-acylating methylmalonate-semialdehyde dehydrogenase, partial [Nitriliruptorales bacterium]